MVRETRYLLVGNLPEKTTEEEITEYFKRYGKIQTVKLQPRPDSPKDREPEEGETANTLSATVAFTDIKSASNAHKAENKIGVNVLTSEYSEGLHRATGSVVTRTREPDIYPRVPPPGPAPAFPTRKGFEEEVDGFDVYYGPTQQYSDAPYPPPSPNLQTRGRPLERTWGRGANFNRGAKWSPGGQGTMRIYTECGSKDVFDPTATTSGTPSATQATPGAAGKPVKKKSNKSRSGSQSSSPCSRHSSSSSDSSTGSSKERKVVASTVIQKMKEPDKEMEKDEIEPGEREPLGVYIRKLPMRSSDTSLRDGLFHEYKKYGKITAVQVSGVGENRFAIVSFKQAEDAGKALLASHDKTFFGSRIVASQHEGLEVEDADFQPPEALMDEHHPKSTRTLFLGNLNKEISVEELKEKLSKYGEILDVDVKRSGAVTAYGFVQYSDITSVVNSLKDLEGGSWDGIKLKVGFGKSMASPVIWLDNIADTVNETFLCRQFSRYGSISHAVIDRVKGRGLVFFMNIECAQYALPEMRNRIWNGKKIHIDFASRDCQDAFFKKMEDSGQLRPGERPEPRTWVNKQPVAGGEQWEDKQPGFAANQFSRGRGRFIRGRGAFRGRGHSFEGGPFPDDYTGKRRQFDEYSTGSGPYPGDDLPYEEALREYGHSQRERRERPHSPSVYDPSDAYYEASSQTSRDYDMYDKPRYEYRSLSPSSDREMDITDDDYKFKSRTTDDRYYYKDKYFEQETKSRDRSHSSDSEQRYRVASEVVTTHNSRSRSPTTKHKRAKDLPISYRSQSPPTPTDDEPQYYHNSRDHSPTDFDNAFRKYEDYKKRLSSSVEVDKHSKSSVLLSTGLRKEIEAKVEDRSSRKRSYDQVSPKRDRLERQLSHGSKSSLYDYDRHEKLTAKELLTKVARLKSEVHERTGKGSPSSLSSHSDIDPSTLSEAELAKLHHEKQKLLDKLTMLDDKVNNSDDDSNGDTRRFSKKARIDEKLMKYFQKSDLQNMTKHELKEKLKLLDVTQSCRKQMEALRKKEKERDLIRELKKTKSASDIKKEMLDYSDDENQLLNSPKEIPSGFMPKKRRKLEGDIDRKSRSYRVRKDHDEETRLSADEKDVDLLQRQISAHSDLFSRSRSASSMDIHLENDSLYSATGALTIYGKDESRRISSGSESNRDKEHSEHKSSHRRRSKNKHDENWITPLIPLGEDDDMPDPEVEDPRPRPRKSDSDLPIALPLPKFAQYIQFSPVSSPHDSNKSHSDLSKTPTPPRACDATTDSNRIPSNQNDTGAAGSDQPYQSPCFSPQSSSSKTHSPSQSPSGSENNSKGNTNSSDNNEEPLGFPKEAEVDDPLDENKPDSLDSLPDRSKTDRRKDSLTDNSDLSDQENTSADNLSIEERIRLLDEKWSKSQAQVAATSKTIPDVESVVGANLSSSPSLVALPVIGTPASSVTTSPSMSSLYSKFRIRKKNETTGASGDKSEPSEIVKTVLSKSSIFDQDSERLGQINSEMYDSKDCNSNSELAESSPQLLSVRTKAEAKEMPMVTLPGSLMERLGQNMSFPTLTVNTSLANQMSLSSNGTNGNKSEPSLCNNLPPPEEFTAKTSPVIKSSVAPTENGTCELPGNSMSSIDAPSASRLHNSTAELELQPPVLETPQKNDISWKSVESVKTETEICQAPELERQQSDSTPNCDSKSSHVVSNTSDTLNNTDNSLDLNPCLPKSILKHSPRKESAVPLVTETSSDCATTPANSSNTDSVITADTAVSESKVKLENTNKTENSRNTVTETPNQSTPSTPVKGNTSFNKETDKKDTLKKELSSVAKDSTSRSAFDVDIFSTSSFGKRKTDEAKSSETKADVKVEKTDRKESDMEVDPEPQIRKAEQKVKSSEKVKSNKEKSKSTKSDSSHEPNKKLKLLKDKKSESVHKDVKHKKKDSKVDTEKKSTSHKSGSERKDEKKEKHKDKQKVDKDSKKDGDKKQQKEDRKDKDEKKKKDTEKKVVKDDKKDKHDEKKEHISKSEKKDKSDTSKKDKEKHDGHNKHDKHGLKSPDKKSVKQTKEAAIGKESVKDSEKNDKKSEHERKGDHSHKKEHKNSTSSSSSHSSKNKKDNGDSKKIKDDHSENKKKEPVINTKDKDSPDKPKDAGGKKTETPPEKEENIEKTKESKEKNSSTGKCKDETNKDKEKENKDKDPDNSKSKPKSGSSSGNVDKLKHQSSDKKIDKSKSETDKNSTKTETKTSKEEKKSKSSKSSKSGTSNPSKSSVKDKDKSKNESSTSKSSSKSTNKSNDSSDRGSTKDKSKETSNSKDTSDSKHKEKESKDHESPHKSDKKTPDHHKEHKSEVERLELMMFDSYEPYVSMYDKVKRRSTDKKDKVKDVADFSKKVNYKKHSYKKKFSLSDVTESSDLSSMDEMPSKKLTPKPNKKKFVFSSGDSDSSSGDDMLMKPKQKAKIQTKKPKRILDVYSSDSEEEELTSKSPSKKQTSSNGKNKKLEAEKHNDYHFDFESLSDTDHKFSNIKPAKSKTAPKTKKTKTTKNDHKANTKPENKQVKKPFKPKVPTRKDFLKDLFSDSDDSDLSDSDSDNIVMKSKLKKKIDPKKNKKLPPKGSSIYTTSEDSDSDEDEYTPFTPPKKKSSPKKIVKKEHESDTLMSDPEPLDITKDKKETKKISNNKKHNDSFSGSDHLMSDPEISKIAEHKNQIKEDKAFEKITNDFMPEIGGSMYDLIKLEKMNKQREKEKQDCKVKEKESKKNKKNRQKSPVIFSDGEQKQLDVSEVYSETVFEKDEFNPLANLTNKADHPPLLSDCNKEPLFKLDHNNKNIPNLKDMNLIDKAVKNKTKKHKDKSKKKKKNKEKDEKQSPKQKLDFSGSLFGDFKSDDDVKESGILLDKSENIKPESDTDINSSGNSTRNLFDDLNDIKSPEKDKKGKTKKESKEQNEPKKEINFAGELEKLTDGNHLSDSDRERKNKNIDENADFQAESEKNELLDFSEDSSKYELGKTNADVFEFKEDDDEDTNLMPLKESHVKIMKPDAYGVDLAIDDDEKADDSANMPIEVQEVEIEVQEHEDVCPEVETSEVVIEMKSDTSIKPEKAKPKPRKRKSRKNSGKDNTLSEEHVIAASLGIEVRPSPGCTDLTIEAVSSLEKVDRNGDDIHTETVQVEAPVSNEQELVIDEGVSLHVEDETTKAIESITLHQNEAEADETAKAVESILFGDEIPYIPDPQTNTMLDQSYMQPDFSQLEGVPQLETEVETTVTEKQVSTPRGKPKGRRGRTKSTTQNKNHVLESIENVSQGITEVQSESDIPNQKQETTSDNHPYNNMFNDDAYFSEASNQHNQNDDDVGLAPLQIDLDPPKREPKQKKTRKPKPTKGNKLAEAAVLTAESMFDKEVSELNRDSISSDNSELERSKHEDLLFMDREDQRHDSDLMSPDERSTSEDLTSPDSAKPRRRGRKPKNYKEMNSGVSPRTNSPRATRTMSPRSPRSNDPKSPKYDIGSPATRPDKAGDIKIKSGKGLMLEDGDMKENMVDKLALPNFEEKSLKGGVNVFDFNDNDESNLVIEPSQTPKRGRQRVRKKADSMQSPEHGILSPGENKLIIGSPDPKFNSPERKMQINMQEKKTIDLKTSLFSPQVQPEEQKVEVNTVADDKPPEPLFKAFFEAKSKSGKPENDRIQPMVISRRPSGGMQDLKVDLEIANETATNKDKLLSPTGVSKAQISQNVDKTINDVSKGLFEFSTDDESYKSDIDDLVGLKDPSKKRQSRKSKEEKPVVPTVNHLQSPPPGMPHMSHPLTLPGMGMPMVPPPPIGEPPVVGHMGLLGQMSPPMSMAARGQGKGQPLSELEVHHANPPNGSKPGLSMPPMLLSPGKSAASITTMVTSTPVSVLTSAGNSKMEPLKHDWVAEGVLKTAMPGVLIPGVSATSAASIIQNIPPVSTAQPSAKSDVTMTVSDAQRKQLEQQKLEHLKLEQQKAQKLQLEQQNEIKKQHELQLQKQQEEQIQLREQEQQRLMDHRAKLQEQHKQMQHQQQQEKLKQEQQLHVQQLEKQKDQQQKIIQKQQAEQQKMLQQQEQHRLEQQQMQREQKQIMQKQQQEQQRQHEQQQIQEQQKQEQEQTQKIIQKQQAEQQKIMQQQQEQHRQEQQQALQQKEQQQQQGQQQQLHEKMLQEHKKHLQEKQKQLEQHLLQQQAAFQAANGQPTPNPMLSPGMLPGPRPNLQSPGSNQGPPPPISAHHPMPPGAAFGLPGQHPGALSVRPSQFPPHLTPAMMSHMIPPLGHDKPPTSQELALKHQQLQQQIAAQAQAQAAQKTQGPQPMSQKVHNQSLAEQQAQLAKQQAQQAQAHAKQQAQQTQQQAQQQAQQNPMSKPGPMTTGPPQGNKGPEQQMPSPQMPSPQMPNLGRKDMLQRPQGPPQCSPQSAALGPPIPGLQDGPRPGSQEAANQLQAHIKQQLAMQNQAPGQGGPPPPGWPPMQARPEGPGVRPGEDHRGSNGTEAMTSMPGPVPVLGGNPQQAQRVSPHPPTKSPTVAQTAPNMGLGFTQHQASAPRAPSPAVAKTAERPPQSGGKWSGSPGAQRPGQSDVRPRPPSTETSPTTSRAEIWGGMHAPPGQPQGLNLTPRPAHQQPPAAHQQQTEHALPRQRPPEPAELGAKDKFMQQQREKQMQQEIQRQKEQLLQQQHELRQRELQQQELRERQLREQAIHAQAQKEVQKEREEREKREREARAGMTSQSPSDPRQSPANGPLPHRMGYPFTESRPQSRDSKIPPQSPGIVDPRDPRFAGQFTNIPGGPHPTDLRMGSSQPSAFSPAAPGSGDPPHMYTPAEIQRLQQNGLIPAYPPGLRMLEPHLMAGHAPYMLPGGVHHLAYMAQQMDHPHLVDGRPPSRGSGPPTSSQPAGHTSNPTSAPEVRTRQNMGPPPSRPSSDAPQPGDGSLLSLLQRYPVMWQGILGLKNDQCVVQMHFISGCQPLVKLSLPQQAPDGTMQPLRIAQRMRLEQTQLEGVAKRMTLEKDYCMMLALPCGRDHTDIYQQTRAMSTGFIQYLQQKQAAGIVNVADPGSQQPAYVVHIFPPCEFSQTTLSRLGFDLLYQVKDLAHLIVIIATVA